MNLSRVFLFKGIPFFNNYNNVRDFVSLEEQDNYFLNKEKIELLQTYQRVNLNQIKIGMSYDDLKEINYMSFINDNKKYYAFVIDLTYINQNTTLLTYEIDVFQSFMFDFNFKTSFVDRKHCKRFDENNKPIIYLQEENLNYGDSYDIKKITKYSQVKALDDNTYDILFMVFATPMDLGVDGFTTYGGSRVNGINTNLFYYITPFVRTGSTRNIKMNNNNLSSPYEVLQNLTANSNIVGKTCNIYFTKFLPVEVTAETKLDTLGVSYIDLKIGSLESKLLPSTSSSPHPIICVPVGIEIEGAIQELDCGNKYDGFTKFNESKLYNYPYSLTQITDFKGHNFICKNEYIVGDNLNIGIQNLIGSYPKTAVLIKNYNQTGYNLENGFIDNDTNDIPIISDATASYIQSSRNVLNLQDNYAIDNANRSILQTNAGLDLATRQIKTNEMLGYIGNGLNLAGGIVGVATGQAGGVNSILSSALGGVSNYYESMYAKEQANQNANFSNINARIGAEQSIGLRQAKLADINNQPPNINGMGKDVIFSYGYDYGDIYVIKKEIKKEYRERLENYFKMFGYTFNDLEIPNLRTRKAFNYLKTTACNIVGNIPQNYLNILKSIFDKGVTIWHNEQMFDYSQNNDEI